MTSMQHMPLFVREYLVDTIHLTLAESGAYLHLLMHAWVKGGKLPDDDTILASCTKLGKQRWLLIRPKLLPFWVIEDGFWSNPRLTKELLYVERIRAARLRAGSKGGIQKRENQRLSSSNTTILPLKPTPTPILEEDIRHDVGTSSNGKGVSNEEPQEPNGFATFWEYYPKRDGARDRKGAIKAFRAALKRTTLAQILMGARAYAFDMTERGKLNTEFVAQARTWLNGDRWNETHAQTANGPVSSDRRAELLAILRSK